MSTFDFVDHGAADGDELLQGERDARERLARVEVAEAEARERLVRRPRGSSAS